MSSLVLVDTWEEQGRNSVLLKWHMKSPLYVQEYSLLKMLSRNECFEGHFSAFLMMQVFKCLRSNIASELPIDLLAIIYQM